MHPPNPRVAHSIFIYGVPGSGKTTIGRDLATWLGYRFVEGDRVRDQTLKTPPLPGQEPFLFCGTTEAWTSFGGLNASTAIRGLLAVRDVLAPYVAKEVEQQSESFVLEAAFLCPADIRSDQNPRQSGKDG